MDTNSGPLLGNFTLPAAIPNPSTGLPQNLRDWQLAASLAQSRGLPEEAGTAAFLGQKISQNAATITTEIRHDAAKITSTLQGGADQLASTLQIGNAISCVGFLAVLNGLHNIKNEQGKTTKAVEQVHATLEAMRVEQRFYAARQTEAIQAILEVLRESRSNEARQLVEQGEKNYKSGYIQESLERFKKALEFDNTDFFVHYQMGLAYAKLDDPAQAEGSMRRAIAFAPEKCPQLKHLSLLTMARILISQGKYPEALSNCREALKIFPDDSPSLILEAEILVHTGPDSELSSRVRQIIAASPQNYYIFLVQSSFQSVIEKIGPLLQEMHDSVANTLSSLDSYLTGCLQGARTDILRTYAEESRGLLAAVFQSGAYHEMVQCAHVIKDKHKTVTDKLISVREKLTPSIKQLHEEVKDCQERIERRKRSRTEYKTTFVHMLLGLVVCLVVMPAGATVVATHGKETAEVLFVAGLILSLITGCVGYKENINRTKQLEIDIEKSNKQISDILEKVYSIEKEISLYNNDIDVIQQGYTL